MNNELEEIFEEADDLKINLLVLCNSNGIIISGNYDPRTKEILLNPCLSREEFGITFIHEMYHDSVYKSNLNLNRQHEECLAEDYAQYMYGLHKEEIDNYLKERGLE